MHRRDRERDWDRDREKRDAHRHHRHPDRPHGAKFDRRDDGRDFNRKRPRVDKKDDDILDQLQRVSSKPEMRRRDDKGMGDRRMSEAELRSPVDDVSPISEEDGRQGRRGSYSSEEDEDERPIEMKAVEPTDSSQEPLPGPSKDLAPEPPEAPSPEPIKPSPIKIYYPAIDGCRSVDEFECLNRIEEGTYGVVYRARDKKSDEVVALKRLKMEREKEGFPITSLREVSTLLKSQHENIVRVREIVVGHNMDKIYMVMDFVEHDLRTLMENMSEPFAIGEVKTLLLQVLKAVAFLHDNWIIHRDLKTSNLLLSNKGVLKVADFGLAREYGSPVLPYTPVVVTLWYRSPELLLGTKTYSTAIDVWSIGCIFAEILTLKPLFPAKSEMEAIQRIFKLLGTPNVSIWPEYVDLPFVKKLNFTAIPYSSLNAKFSRIISQNGLNLMNKFFIYNPSTRISASDAIDDKYFNESPLPVATEMFPTWPAKSEMMKKGGKMKAEDPKAPEGGKLFADTREDDSQWCMKYGYKLPPHLARKDTSFTLKF